MQSWSFDTGFRCFIIMVPGFLGGRLNIVFEKLTYILHIFRISSCSSKDLSVLLEEGDRSSALNQSYPSSQSNQSAHSLQFRTDSEDQSHLQRSRTDELGYSQPEKTSLSDLGCSVEVWTLSRDSDSLPNSVSSRDSGHSSSITSFDKDRIPALQDSIHFHR